MVRVQKRRSSPFIIYLAFQGYSKESIQVEIDTLYLSRYWILCIYLYLNTDSFFFFPQAMTFSLLSLFLPYFFNVFFKESELCDIRNNVKYRFWSPPAALTNKLPHMLDFEFNIQKQTWEIFWRSVNVSVRITQNVCCTEKKEEEKGLISCKLSK